MKYFSKIIKNRILFPKEIQSKSLFLIKKNCVRSGRWCERVTGIRLIAYLAKLSWSSWLAYVWLIRENRSIMRYYAITCSPRGQTRSLGIIIIIGGGLTLIMRAVMQYISTSDHLRGAFSLPNMTTFNW